MFILVNPRKHGGHCPPKSHGQGAHGTQPFSCLFFSSQPCAFQKFGFSIFICLSIDSDLFGIQVFYRYPRISSLSNHANRHTAPQPPKRFPSGAGSPEEISKSDTGATRASRVVSGTLPLWPWNFFVRCANLGFQRGGGVLALPG